MIKGKRKSQLLAILLTLVMIFGIMPGTVVPAADGVGYISSDIEITMPESIAQPEPSEPSEKPGPESSGETSPEKENPKEENSGEVSPGEADPEETNPGEKYPGEDSREEESAEDPGEDCLEDRYYEDENLEDEHLEDEYLGNVYFEDEYFEDKHFEDGHPGDEYHKNEYFEDEYDVSIEALAHDPTHWKDAMDDALGWLLVNIPNPGLNNEWAVLAVARANIAADVWYGRYLSALEARIGDLFSWTDFQRATLALTSLGLDASDFGGHNLTASFMNFTPAVQRPAHSQGITTDIFALIALDSRPYTGPGRQQYIQAILSAQEADGSWSWGFGPEWDADLTAMAVQALAPYYGNNANVRVSIDNAINWLLNHNLTSAEEYAQIIVALTALGRGGEAERFVNGLLTFRDPVTGGFTGWAGVNIISTEQAAYALVAYYRYINGMDALFDMRDAGDRNVTPPLPPGGGGGGENGGGNGTTPPDDERRAFIRVRDGNNVFFEGYIDIAANETAYSLLRKTGLAIISRNGYVVSINGLAEFDYGPGSGWMFTVNGNFPDIASIQYVLGDGDRVEWLYTRDLGDDVGGGIGDESDGDTFENHGMDEGSAVAEIEAEVTDGTAVAEVPAGLIRSLIADALADRVRNITIIITTPQEAARFEVNLTLTSVDMLVENNMTLTIKSDIAAVTFDSDTLAGILQGEEGGGTLSLIIELTDTDNENALDPSRREIIGDNKVISLVLMVGDRVIRQFAGTVTVSVSFRPPAGFRQEDRDLLTIYHINDGGEFREMTGARYLGGAIRFTTDHFSLFFISEWISPFEDVSRGDWFLRGVRFVYSKRLMGVKDAAGPNMFLPDMKITLPEIAYILWQLEGRPAVKDNIKFYDYYGYYDYYAYAVAWAGESGILTGTGGYVILEELAVILKNYGQFTGMDTYLDPYAEHNDMNDVSPWAYDAVLWIKENDLIPVHPDYVFVPGGMVTRAEIAEILRRFMS